MKGFGNALDKLIRGFEGFTEELREIADDAPLAAGQGEEADGQVDYDYGHDDADDAPVAGAPRNDIDDDTMVTLRSGDLRKVIDAYRRFNRYAREGKIMTQDERNVLHRHIKKVKHLIRRPIK